ncbi:MAG: single-stranded-DNA-specific exonuclease RecJ [Candidatus Taylorbacteria bacterium RIFCSPHIGHO2_01_FULL_51_15]|uniref:Single-stranded-DNA-specific exonuclease RecJ n=1 Tax=Candidatus Taylorbacteria bacterium RIFCSPHIGHO2_01_FULL_51_15 TaxID=1802304 RepID=A0A1G2MCA3_9BACT|nr:MAG: single-stranded-DNA-specific exonuclease RecJ [Candidatus Taylorbacteria bacterium RIFCSPHIGHO2_01_FULL_51_15]
MPSYTIREAPSSEAEKELIAYSPLLRQLLHGRGITEAKEAEQFLHPNYDAHTHDPFTLKDMEKAVERILRSVQNNERIAIFSDYDADGIPGAVVLHDFFKRIGHLNFENYIPDRHGEGFGLNASAIRELHESGCRLLITIDCGITDTEEVAHAIELGMDVIITDHHLPGAEIPHAYAILNPKQADCRYPEKMLCGSGVIFKLIQALCFEIRNSKFDIPETIFPAGQEKWLLDMVGLATLSDMVPLTGENRVFAHFGLKVLRKSPRKGLRELLSVLRLNRSELTEDDIGFSISPRINAASRMGVPMDAFRLFATSDEAEAATLARHLDKMNTERKGKVASLVKEVRRTVEERGERKVIVAGNPNWRPALLGLVASSLAEDMRCPVFLWGREESVELKGSCRSGGSVDLSLMMQEARSVFSDFGGHKEAGGFSTTLEKVHLLEAELERAYEKVRSDYNSGVSLVADAALSLDEVTARTYSEIAQLSPFGVGNHKPVFLFEQVKVRRMEQFGKEKQHLKLIFAKSDGVFVPAIQFYAKPEDFGVEPREGGVVNLLAHFEKSTFGNRTELRLRIVDVF